MPIVSRNLVNFGQQADGTFRVREDHTDTLGVVWSFAYRTESLEAATIIMNGAERAAAVLRLLRERDFSDVRDHVAQGFNNNPGTFNYTTPLRDIVLIEAQDEVVTHFAEMLGDIAQPFAWYIQNLNNPQWNTIWQRIGYTQAQADNIRSRATSIITAAPTYNLLINDPRG